ncbi:FAD/NAD(P)-binding protein [Tateyamaria omphalii]|uniref:FAD/NAD(P)-binding protein n=1 Tax=Tateyamaria omphalii TaxID=299262 RepID=UPI001C9A0587|nr:FAD/NAD(P)-binding protein [Tateyamaria omphalii]MBY5933750.1 FAD/NAD(P)-binding protein [Tateyamaria omphalii]
MSKIEQTLSGLKGDRTHVIVGDGITALAFLEASISRDIDHVVVIGARASQLGRGAAYAKGEPDMPWRYAYLLNSPADDIDPKFAKWLADRWDSVSQRMQGRSPDWLGAAASLVANGDVYGVNAPREFYGDFMEEQAQTLIAGFETRGVTVTLLDDIATSLNLGENTSIGTKGGRTLCAKTVDVAPGGPSTMRIQGDDGAFSAPSVFGFETRIAEHIKSGAEIFCIGGNAAMLDVLRLCQSLIPERDLRFVACAPDGEIPTPLVPRLPRKLTRPHFSTDHETADSFLAEVRREIDKALSDGDEMREIRAGFRAHFLENPLSTYLPNIEEARKVPGALRFWLRGGTRDTIHDMHRFVDEGKARVVTGLVQKVVHQDDGAEVVVTEADGQQQRIKTGFVVNCAGAGPGSQFDPLTEDMLAQGLLSRSHVGGGLQVGAGCHTTAQAVRYLSPAVSEIGDEVVAMPLYDAHMLRSYVARSH